MLRATFVILVTIFGAALSFKDAFYGLLLYTWYSYTSPLDLTYGILADTKLSFLVAGIFICTGFFQTRQLFRKSILTFLMIAFAVIAFSGLATLGTYNVKSILEITELLNKLIIVAVFCPVVVRTVTEFKFFTLAITLSVGLLAAYYGIFGLFSGSTYIVGAGRIGDNNFYALLLVCTLPLILLCIKHFKPFYVRIGLLIVLVGTLTAIMLTYSRGGFLATLVVLAAWLFSWRKKLLIPFIIGCFLCYYTLTSFKLIRDYNEFAFEREFRKETTVSETIDQYLLRISTLLSSPEEIDSAQSRMHFWKVAVLMANDKPFWGVGLKRFESQYSSYDYSGGAFGGARSVHSTPMLILAEMGYLGLLCFLAILLSAFIILKKVRKLLRSKTENPEAAFLYDAAGIIMISFLGFMVAGSLVVGLYVEIFWSLVSLSIICQYLTKNFLENENTTNNSLPT